MEYAYDACKDEPYVSNISQTRENSYSENVDRCSQLLLSRWIYKTGCQVSSSSFIKLSLHLDVSSRWWSVIQFSDLFRVGREGRVQQGLSLLFQQALRGPDVSRPVSGRLRLQQCLQDGQPLASLHLQSRTHGQPLRVSKTRPVGERAKRVKSFYIEITTKG